MNRKKSVILKQLLTPIVVTIIILGLLIVSIMGVIFYKTYESRVIADSESETQLISDNVREFISKAYGISEELAKSPDILTMDTEIQSPILADCVERNPYLELLYIQDTTGMQTGRSSGELADRSERWWFKQTVADKVSFVSKSYYSVNTGSPCASIFFPMYNEGEFIGVFATDIKLQSLVDLVVEYSDTDNDKTVFIIDGEGTVVAHPDASYIEELYNYVTYTRTVSKKDDKGNVMTDADGNIVEEEKNFKESDSFKKMIEEVMSGKSGNCIVTVGGNKYYATYSPIVMDGESDSWSVITIQRRGTLMKPLYIMLLVALLIAACMLALAIVLVRSNVKKITNPLIELTDIIGVASEGDFSVKAKVTDNQSELGALAESFNFMTDKIAYVLGETKRLLDDVHGSADKLSELSAENDSVAQEMDKISFGASVQSTDTEKVVKLTEEMKECTSELYKMSEQLKKQASASRSISDEGIYSVGELKKKSQASLDAIMDSYDKVLSLNESSKKIGTIIEEINNISSQTSLLSLNASIEAARAGEAGRGFAVVASEVSELANSSNDATQGISEIVIELQEGIKGIVELIDGIKSTFEEQLVSVDVVEESFSRFKESSESSISTANEVGELIGSAGNVNDEVLSAITNIHEISRETEVNAKGASDRVSHQVDSIKNIAEKVDNMNKASDLLEEEMSRFKI